MSTTDSGLTWYFEGLATFHFLEAVEGIQVQYQLYEVSFQESLNNSSTVFGLYATVGMAFF
jgi:hypothetical protein